LLIENTAKMGWNEIISSFQIFSQQKIEFIHIIKLVKNIRKQSFSYFFESCLTIVLYYEATKICAMCFFSHSPSTEQKKELLTIYSMLEIVKIRL